MSRPTRPSPAALQARVAASSISAVARELGVSRTSVRAWMAEAVQVQPDVHVEVQPPPLVSAMRPPPVVIRRVLPGPPWYTRVPVWVWSLTCAAVLIVWAFRLWPW